MESQCGRELHLHTSGRGCWPSIASRLESDRVGSYLLSPCRGARRSWDLLTGSGHVRGRNSLNIDGQSLATEYSLEVAVQRTAHAHFSVRARRGLAEVVGNSEDGRLAAVLSSRSVRHFVMCRFLHNFLKFIKLLFYFLFYQLLERQLNKL